MPQSRKRKTRNQTSSGSQSDARNLLVFSIDNPLDYAPKLGKVAVAMAANDQARARGEAVPFLAGFDKLSDLRPASQQGEGGESEASNA